MYEAMLMLVQELQQLKRVNTRREEEMLQRHNLEKRRLPRIQKGEMKTRQQLFKQSLRISSILSPEEERDKIKNVSFVLSLINKTMKLTTEHTPQN